MSAFVTGPEGPKMQIVALKQRETLSFINYSVFYEYDIDCNTSENRKVVKMLIVLQFINDLQICLSFIGITLLL